jgi:hypothetical protein
MNSIELLKFMLPDFLVDYLKYSLLILKNTYICISEEKAKPPKEFDNLELVSKGFLDEITFKIFPLRGKFVYLHIKRRRWTNKTTREIVRRDWELVAKGTRMTHEFASFLKEINR